LIYGPIDTFSISTTIVSHSSFTFWPQGRATIYNNVQVSKKDQHLKKTMKIATTTNKKIKNHLQFKEKIMALPMVTPLLLLALN